MVRPSDVLARWVRELPPDCFALVMATGIVSGGLRLDGWRPVSEALLWLGVAGFAGLLVATGWRLLRHRSQVVADELDPSRSFAFFTVAAGADVLANRLALDERLVGAAVFLVIGSVTWLLLGYTLPLVLMTRHGLRPALAQADGTWFLWIVGAQSVVVAVTALPGARAGWLEPLAVTVWCVGVVLYLAVAVLVLGRLFAFPVQAGQFTPSYWVFMGATAISALAGARLPHWTTSPLIAAVTPMVAGLSVLLWAFGTWTIPALVIQSVWWEEARPPLLYDHGMWSIVFPVGMYGVASRQLGNVVGAHWMSGLGSDVIWAGAVLWLLVFASMTVTAGHAFLRPAPGARP